MNIAVGLVEGKETLSISLNGEFRDASGRSFRAGQYQFRAPVELAPLDPVSAAFTVDDFRIGVGFHWERSRPCAFPGSLRIIDTGNGLTAVNDVALEAYVRSVIAAEMSPESPVELLRAHAVVSRSWIVAQLVDPQEAGTYHSRREVRPGEWEILSWYGCEGHAQFDVCADDHCQRYQGLPPPGSERVSDAIRDTTSEFLVFDGGVCDARFYKCCGGVTEDYRAAWEDRHVRYLTPVYDGTGPTPEINDAWFRSSPADVYCNTRDTALLERILTGFDQETTNFFRWKVEYSRDELSDLVRKRSEIDLGQVLSLGPLERGRSGRIVKLRIQGTKASLIVGKELEIRRLLSPSHLYSSAFVVDQNDGRTVLIGAGWGHGVGLCQIGAAVMAEQGMGYRQILRHYYPGRDLETRVYRDKLSRCASGWGWSSPSRYFSGSCSNASRSFFMQK
jgi:SpoIID/LytB domain protein